MANRHALHISKLEAFKEWLAKDGWEIEEPKGDYEVLRARKQGRQNPLIVYTKADAKEHLSIMDRDSGVIGAFLKDCRDNMEMRSDGTCSILNDDCPEKNLTDCKDCQLHCVFEDYQNRTYRMHSEVEK